MAYGPTLDETLARYAEAWSTSDADARWSLVHSCTAGSFSYVDPHSEKPVESQAAFAAFTGLFHEQVGWRLEWAGEPDAHHGWVRAPWRLTDGGVERETGLLVASLVDGRLATVLHFVDD